MNKDTKKASLLKNLRMHNYIIAIKRLTNDYCIDSCVKLSQWATFINNPPYLPPEAIKTAFRINGTDTNLLNSIILKTISTEPYYLALGDYCDCGFFQFNNILQIPIDFKKITCVEGPLFITNAKNAFLLIDWYEEEGDRYFEVIVYTKQQYDSSINKMSITDNEHNIVKYIRDRNIPCIEGSNIREVCHYICAMANSLLVNKTEYIIVKHPSETFIEEIQNEMDQFSSRFAFKFKTIGSLCVIALLPSKYNIVYYRGHCWYMENGLAVEAKANIFKQIISSKQKEYISNPIVINDMCINDIN